MPITPAMLRAHLDLLAEATVADLDELLHDLLATIYPGRGPEVCQNN
jgi:hypothetical protein